MLPVTPDMTTTAPRSPLLALVSLLALAGCGGDDDPYAHYFRAKPYSTAECNQADAALGGRREIRLFTYGNADAPPFSRSLQRYYQRHGLRFFSKDPVMQVAQDYILDTDGGALNAGLAREFPGVDLDDEDALRRDPALYERVVKYTMNFVFRPILEFARSHGTVGTEVTNLVVVPEILRPDGDSVLEPGAQVAGLAISPALLEVFAQQDLDEAATWKLLDLPKDFTPMMFLDGRVLALLMSARPDLADLVAAHEFGHTAALVHRLTENNLMFPSVHPGSACTDGLEDDQLAAMRGTLADGHRMALTRRDAPAAPGAGTLEAALPVHELQGLVRGEPGALRRIVRRFAH
jgi:hypothetical protein